MILPVKSLATIDNLSMLPYKDKLEKLEKIVRFCAFIDRVQHELYDEHVIELDAYHKFKTSMIDPSIGITGAVDFLISNHVLGTYPLMLSKDNVYRTNVVDRGHYSIPTSYGRKDNNTVLYRINDDIIDQEGFVVGDIMDFDDEGAMFQYQTLFHPRLMEHLVYNSYVKHHAFMYDYSLSVHWDDADYLEVMGHLLSAKLGLSYVE